MITRVNFFSFLLVIGFVTGCDTAPSSSSASTTIRSDSFTFTIPEGWISVKPDRKKTKAELLYGSKTWYRADAMIRVDSGKPAIPNAMELAKSFAESDKGKLLPDTVDLAGETGYVVVTESKTLRAPCYFIAVIRNEKCYLLMGASKGKVEVKDVIDEIRQSWEWID